MSGVKCHISGVACHLICSSLLFSSSFLDKVVGLVVKGLLSMGPNPSSLLPTAIPVLKCVILHRHFCLTMAVSAL